MVKDSQYPLSTDFTVVAVGQNRSVLDGDRDLIVKTIGNPATQLFCRKLSLCHHDVKRMVDVVTGAFASEQGFKLFLAPRFTGVVEYLDCNVSHSVISIPSNATSMPCSVSVFRSGLLSFKMGLVLLM